MKRRMMSIALLFLFFITGNVNGQTNKQKVLSELNQLYQYLDENKLFNGAIGVRYHGEIIFKKGLGTGDFERNTPFTPYSQTEIGSMSKQFTAAAIMILWKNGQLQLDDDINKYLSPSIPYKGITVRHLLSHQSGLPNYTSLFKKDNWDVKKVATNEDIIRLLIKYHPDPLFKPGTQFKYSNTGYIVLAEIVQHITGKNLGEFLNEMIFRPFGMSSTGFYPRETIYKMPLYAPGVALNKKTQKLVRPESLTRFRYVTYLSGRFGSGRLTSSINDIFVWDSLLYTQAFLPQPIIQEMYAPQVKTTREGYDYGFGWYVNESDPSTVYHTGSWPGNRTYIKRHLKEHSTVIVFNNTNTVITELGETIDKIIQGLPWELPKKK